MLQPRNETVLAEQPVGVLDAHKVLVTQLLILSHKTESYPRVCGKTRSHVLLIYTSHCFYLFLYNSLICCSSKVIFWIAQALRLCGWLQHC